MAYRTDSLAFSGMIRYFVPKKVEASTMLKRAISLFAFSLFFLGCQSKLVYHPPFESKPLSHPSAKTEKSVPLPDLTISDIIVDEPGNLIVFLSNIGVGRVSSPSGHLKIYLDSVLKWTIAIDRIPDPAFLQPGGMTRYVTPIRLEESKLARAIIDSEEEIVEENESNNILTKKLYFETLVRLPSPSRPPPVLPAPQGKPERLETAPPDPDITIKDLTVNSKKQLVVILANPGEGLFF